MKLDVERVRLDRGGYDRRGRYWGSGAPLYRVTSDEPLSDAQIERLYGTSAYYKPREIDEYVRASNAREAREKVAGMYRLERVSARDRRRMR